MLTQSHDWSIKYTETSRHDQFKCDFILLQMYIRLFSFVLSTISIHYNDVIMNAMASKITSHTIVYSTVNSCADQRKHQSSASLAFVRGIHRGPVNSSHKGPVTWKMLPFDDVIMVTKILHHEHNTMQYSSWNFTLHTILNKTIPNHLPGLVNTIAV